jgi:hypothetical protein
VEIDHRPQALEVAVVHVRLGDSDVAQRRRLELAVLVGPMEELAKTLVDEPLPLG